ncbi:stressosome-associated protein Prli42 [Paenibacillus albiflavus]
MIHLKNRKWFKIVIYLMLISMLLSTLLMSFSYLIF